MKYISKKVFDAEQLTEELALDCLINKKKTRLGFSVSGTLVNGKATAASIHVTDGSLAGLGDWVVVEDGRERVYTNELFLSMFDPCKTHEYWTDAPDMLPDGCEYELPTGGWVVEDADPMDWGNLRRRWPIKE